MDPSKALVPTGTDPSDEPTASAEDVKKARLDALRAARAEFNTVTVGGAKAPKPKPAVRPTTDPGRARELDAAPVYRFQIVEAFEHDVPRMRAPTAVTQAKLKTVVNTEERGRRVVPLPQTFMKPAPTPDLESRGPAGPGATSGELVLAGSGGGVGAGRELVDPDAVLMTTIQAATTAKPQTMLMARATVAPNDELDIANLHSAEDVISYFSIHGANKAVKFVYCNHAEKQGTEFRPYDLIVVPRKHVQSEHYVISASGVVHILPPKEVGRPPEPAEVITLSDWMRESAMFSILRKIRFFRNYLIFKAFQQWMKNIRLRVYCATRRTLCKKFFLSKSTFASTTMELFRMSHELSNDQTKLFYIVSEPGQSKPDYTIAEFTKDQQSQLTKAASSFNATMSKMEERLVKLTEAIQQRANVPDLTTMESLEQYLQANSVATGRDKKAGKKMKSMLEAKHEQHERMRELKRSMVEQSMLDSYIRLIDNIAAEAIFKNALLTVQGFYDTVAAQRPVAGDILKKIGFSVVLVATEESVHYTPSEDDIINAYDNIVAEMMTHVHAVPRLAQERRLKLYFHKHPKIWNINVMYGSDARVLDTKNKTHAIIHDNFDRAEVKRPLYAKYTEWYVKFSNWKAKKEEWVRRTDLKHTDFEAELDDIRSGEEDKKSIPPHADSIIQVSFQQLQTELSEKLNTWKDDVKVFLRDTSFAGLRKLEDYFKEKEKGLKVYEKEHKADKPDIKKFAEFVRAVREVEADKHRIEQDVEEAQMLYTLIENLQTMKEMDPNFIEAKHKTLRERLIGAANAEQATEYAHFQFQQLSERALATMAAKREQHISELDQQIHNLNRRAMDNVTMLNGEDLISFDQGDRKPHDEIPEATTMALQHLQQIYDDPTSGVGVKSLMAQKEQFDEFFRLFNDDKGAGKGPDWTNYNKMIKVYEARSEVWNLLSEFDEKRRVWWSTPLKELDADEVEKAVKEYFIQAFKCEKTFKSKDFDDVPDTVSSELVREIKQMKTDRIDTIKCCANKDMTKDHWLKVGQQVSGFPPYKEDLALANLEECDIWSVAEVVKEQAETASGEAALSKALAEIKDVWENKVDFSTKKYRDDGKEIFILDKIDDIIQQLDDHHVQLQTITASRHVAAVRSRVEDWIQKLRTVNDVVDEWVTMQKNWMYLEFIFSSDDIKVQLPTDSERFEKVDQLFKEKTTKAARDKNVLIICTEPDFLAQLKANNAAIDRIQKNLENYLETKRDAFARFYFLSNDELLSILSDVRNPRAVQPHLSKCFDSIALLRFNDEKASEIGGMISGEGEEVPFQTPVMAQGNVEQWLGRVEATMRTSLHQHLRDTVEAYPRVKREEWMLEGFHKRESEGAPLKGTYAAQCIQATDMIQWTAEVEQAIGDNSVKAYFESYVQQILRTVAQVRKPLTKLQRTLVCTLIVVDVHNRDIVRKLVDNDVRDVADFEWFQQLRYYWENDPSMGQPNCGIHHCTAHLWYGYEYIGNQPRLVITPLTDRAFLTCTSALEMNLGAAPQGPAGTGKTESVKDLGKALARQVVVFNCSDGISYKTMSRMFAGLAQAGAWACFDEFNRIELEVLSVIAQQMLEIVSALGQKLETMDFDGRKIRLSKNFGVFITMNPGYAGRTELPDNLKALFRPICMMIPDYALIAEIMFFSEGFEEARTLAQKMVQLYKLSSEQLSKQDHYDFGMRAVKSILVMAGALKRSNPDEDENMLLIRAMRDANVPKFLRDDTVLFMALIKDLFPSVEIREAINRTLLEYIERDAKANNLQVVDGFVLKTRQLFETMEVRHGVMTVGQTMCAKTAVLETLQRTLTAMKLDNKDPEGNIPLVNVVHTHVLNPKSITMGELYGDINPTTREWTDGLLSRIARDVKSDANTKPDRNWIVFDGPVDAIWIENMNTVLDDNKMLCLFNGERIKLPATASFMFEVQDLRVASPATVSRCGMVFLEPYYLNGGWRPVTQSMLTTLEAKYTPEKFKTKRVLAAFDKIVPPLLTWYRKSLKEYIPTVDAQLATSCLELLSGFLMNDFNNRQLVDLHDDVDPVAAEAAANDPMLADFRRPAITAKPVLVPDKDTNFDMWFVLAIIWSFGGNVSTNDREAFSNFLKPLLQKEFPCFPKDDDRNLFQLWVDKKSQTFITWDHIVPTFLYDRRLPYFELFVPTAETTATKTILTVLTSVSRNVLVTGATGTGKSIIVQDLLVSQLKGDDPQSNWEYFTTTFSAQTRSIDLEQRLGTKLHKIKGNLAGASPGKRAIFFVDDVNMPQLEKYGASPPVELLRQFISQQGYYDRSKQPVTFRNIQDIIFIAACGVPGGGRNALTARLTSRFHLLCQPDVSHQSMRRIFTTILGGFLQLWPDDVRKLAPSMVHAARLVYEKISREKLPTPAKSHYLYNLRDFGKVFQGILQVQPDGVPDKDGMLRLFIHEISRVFHDRLTDDADKEWWWATLGETMRSEFEVTWKPQYESLLFGDYMNLDKEKRQYMEVPDFVAFQDKLTEYQESYNVDNNKDAELVFFSDAAHHISRICRIIRQPRGCAMLVGVGGSGRQSLTRLAAYVCGQPVFQIAITRNYGIDQFRENLKEALLEAGCFNKPVVFLLADNQIIKEQFLEDINNILNTGEVPNLMQPEDNDKIINSVRKFVQEAKKPETRSVMLAHFLMQCRDNFHVVLTMSPVGDDFRRRLRMFPSLVNCTTIDWFMKWPTDALEGVATRSMGNIAVDDAYKPALAKMCVRIHQDVQQMSSQFFEELRRHNYTTPTSYLELLNSYKKMVSDEAAVVTKKINTLSGGLSKLVSTQQTVDELKEQLVEMQPKLEQASKDTERIMAEVKVQQAEADEMKAKCKKEEDAAGAIRDEAEGVAKECEEKLEEAMPAYRGALDALKALDPKDISEIKKLGQPPEGVRIVIEAVCVLLGQKDLSWNNCKLVIGKSDFLNSLREYKKDDVPEKIIRTLERNYINNKEMDFTPEMAAKASAAAKSLCLWVIAIDKYTLVAKTIAPKREQLAEARKKLKAAEDALDEAQGTLRKVEERVANLKREMQANVDKKKQLEDDMKLAELRLSRADKLMSGLASEQVRWQDSVVKLKRDVVELVGTMMLAAGCVAYLGPFTAPYRTKMIREWAAQCKELKIPVSGTGFSLADIADPAEVRQWAKKGLPSDNFSVENGVIVNTSQRWPLCIDPQGQANTWIRAKERDNNLSIIKLSEKDYMRKLENAVKIGLPVLLENVEESIDAVIDPILTRQTYQVGARTVLRLGDNEIDYDKNFRFFITTKLPNPHFMPELQIKVTIVNFTVTQKGLEEQLLVDVVRHEQDVLEQRADKTVVEIAEGKEQLKAIEARILDLLASSTGMILDNELLINALGDAKVTSTNVAQNLEMAEKTKKEIDGVRDRYRPVATRGSLIYTVISLISGIEHMYQYSLDFFKRLFGQTLKNTEPSTDIEKRCATLLPAITRDTYNTVCRGLFERDKQLFSFMMVAEIFRASGDIKDNEWSYFLRGSAGEKLAEDGDWPEWSTEGVWNDVLALCELEAFSELKDEIAAHDADWKKWAASDDAYKQVPGKFGSASEWHQLLVVRAFREDLLIYGMNTVIGAKLGKVFTESPPFDLEASFRDSSTIAPIIFLLTAGSDPTSTFTEFAEKQGFGDKKHMLSLGQDQGVKAKEMIETACAHGEWVYLQNCHVYASWMPELERILEGIMMRDVKKEFRLWLTTMPTKDFPALVLQSGVKVTKEPPKGLKANLKDSFLQEVTPELWDNCKNANAWKRLLFSLAFFHAVIQERRKYGALGWNVPYEWNQSDFSASIKSLHSYLSDYDQVPWPALRYMIGVINYGGRVTDFLDARCVQSLLAKFFHETVLAEGAFKITADGLYQIPADVSDINTVKKYLDDLPPYETPELFGLHANADITSNRNSSRRQLDTILSVQPRAAGGDGVNPDDKVFDIASRFVERLPALIDMATANEETYRVTDDGTMVSLGTVCMQEIEVFNRIASNLRSTLLMLQKAIKGQVVMDAILEHMYNSFLIGKVPDNWHTGSYLSKKPLASWFDDTLNRIEFLRDWNDNGPPASFWISGFFFPQGFLTGVLQTHSRTFKMPIDDITFKSNVTHANTYDQLEGLQETGVCIHGLFMEGARWNAEKGAIDESRRGELFTNVPVIWLEPVPRSAVQLNNPSMYNCPLYKTTERKGALSTTGLSTNFVLSMQLPTGAAENAHWVQRGVALLCMLDN